MFPYSTGGFKELRFSNGAKNKGYLWKFKPVNPDSNQPRTGLADHYLP